MTADSDESSPASTGGGRARLHLVAGPRPGHEPLPPTRLHREWKGTLLADLVGVDRVHALPGTRHRASPIGAAERSIRSAVVIDGPGHRPGHGRRWRWVAAALVLAGSALAALAGGWLP